MTAFGSETINGGLSDIGSVRVVYVLAAKRDNLMCPLNY